MTKIQNNNLSDHQNLINLVNEGLKIIENIRDQFKYTETTNLYDIDIIKYCMYQISLLKTSYKILQDNRFIEIFIILRSVFEQYYRILLMSKGIKYAHDYFVTEKDEKKMITVFEGALKQIEKGIKDGEIDNVIKVIPYKYNKIRLIRKGLYSKDDERIIPVYYFEYKNHQPRKVFVDSLKTFKDLEPNGVSVQKWIKHHKQIYHQFIRFDTGVKEALFINDEIDEYGWDRIIVHYNFMSLFTHIDNSAIEEIEGRHKPAYITKLENYRKFDHNLSELCLLYILRMLEYYFSLIFLHNSTSYKIMNVEDLHSYVCKVKNETRYLYFITDTPHDFDKINFRTNGKIYELLTGQQPKAYHIYYNNPLKRLKKMHDSFVEYTTGDVFDSPFK